MKRCICLMLVVLTASVACANLITNGDFDSGGDNWGYGSAWGNYFYTDGTDTVTSMGGWGDGWGNTWSNTSLWQDTGAVFQADTVYTMEVVWREAPGEASIESVMLLIQDTSSSTEWVDVASDWYSTSQGTAWNTSTLTFDTADNSSVVGESIGVSFRLTSADGTWIHVDSVTLVPEPTTLFLLGAGSVLSVFCRRK